MSQLKMVLASATAALALAVLGPLFFGTAAASADGPHMNPAMGQQRHVVDGHRHDVDLRRHDRDDHPRRDRDDFPRRDHDRDDFPRHDRDDFPRVRVFRTVEVVRPVVEVTQPIVVFVSAPAFVPTFSIHTFSWMGFGPNWDAGWTLAQIQQLCQQYNQTVVVNPGAFNPNVQAVCDGGIVGNPY